MVGAGTLTERDIQAIDAAKLYYGGNSQDEVARTMGLSRPTVSKLLQHAENRGFVKITVVDPRVNASGISDELEQLFNLRSVTVVYPASPNQQTIRDALGQGAAEILTSVLRDGDVLGIAWSRTIDQVSKYLPDASFRDVKIVSLQGYAGVNIDGASEIQTFEAFGRGLSGQVELLNIPLIFDSLSVKTAVEGEGQVRQILKQMQQVRVALFTVGDITESSYFLNESRLTEVERATARDRAVGEICSRLISAEGRIIMPDLNNRTAGVTLSQLRKIPAKILVAGGPAKIPVIKAALRNGYVDHLVTDAATGEALLQEIG